MSEIEKMYENAGVKPEYRYDCNLADTIKPVEVFPLRSCSKGEIKDYCTNKQDYQYCKVYKVNKIYSLFTAEKQIELIKLLSYYYDITISKNFENDYKFQCEGDDVRPYVFTSGQDFAEQLAVFVNMCFEYLPEEEKQQVKGILE